MAIDPVCGMTVDEATARSGVRDGNMPFSAAMAAGGRSSPLQPQPTSACQSWRHRTTRLRNAAAAPGPSSLPREPRGPSTPARCTRRSSRSGPAPARSAAWTWSRRRSRLDAGDDDPELRGMTRRFWIAAALTLPVFLAVDAADARRAGRSLAGRRRRSRGCSWCSPRRSCSGPAGRSSSGASASFVHRPPQHVHADRHRHRRRLPLQPRRGAVPGADSAPVPARRRRCRCTSRRRR